MDNWTLDRLAAIDRNILRLAAYEMLKIEYISYKTTINEAIEIAKRFSSEQSGKFVNGVLDRLYRNSGGTLTASKNQQEGPARVI